MSLRTMIKTAIVGLLLATLQWPSPAAAEPSFGITQTAGQGYRLAWSKGSPNFDPYGEQFQVISSFADGSVLYGKLNAAVAMESEYLEIGLFDRNGKTVWKREGSFFTMKHNEQIIAALAPVENLDHRQDRILFIRIKDGALVSQFSLKTLGIYYTGTDVSYSLDNKNQVYISDANRLFALNANGKLLWKKVSPIPGDWSMSPIYAPPIQAEDGNLYTWTRCSGSERCSLLEDEEQLISLKPNGQENWSVQFRNSAYEPTFWNGQMVVENAFEDTVAAFRMADGKQLWSFKAEAGPWYMMTPGLKDRFGWTFIEGSNDDGNGGAVTEKIIALDQNGTKKWELQLNETTYYVRGISADGALIFVEGEEGMSTVRRSDGAVVSGTPYYRFSGNGHQAADPKVGPYVMRGSANYLSFDRYISKYNQEEYERIWSSRLAVHTLNQANVGTLTISTSPLADWRVGPNHDIIVWTPSQIKVFRPAKSYVSVQLNGVFMPLSQPAVIVNGVTLVPLRGVMEHAGVQVGWNQKTKTVTLQKGSDTIMLKVGSKKASVNGVSRSLDVSPSVVNGSTMIPLRFVLETLKAQVTWDPATQTVGITNK